MKKLPPSIRFTPALYGILALAVVAGILTLLVFGVIETREISASLLAMLGTFLGALLAFRLNERKDELKLQRERRLDLNRALFTLARQCNAIANLQKNLAPYKSDLERAFNCPALRLPDYQDVSLDFGALGFILETKPSLLLKLSIEEEGFQQAMFSLKARNEFYVTEIQPAIAKHGLNRKQITLSELEQALGERLMQSAVNTAGIMYRLAQKASEELPMVHAELYDIAKEVFPDAQFVKLEEKFVGPPA